MQYLDMGNYAFYVWMAYGVSALAIVIEVASLAARSRAAARAATGAEDAP